jgi:hypothetical protein
MMVLPTLLPVGATAELLIGNANGPPVILVVATVLVGIRIRVCTQPEIHGVVLVMAALGLIIGNNASIIALASHATPAQNMSTAQAVRRHSAFANQFTAPQTSMLQTASVMRARSRMGAKRTTQARPVRCIPFSSFFFSTSSAVEPLYT